MHITPTEKKIIDLLSDGLPHGRFSVQECTGEKIELNTLAVHLFNIRRKLRPFGRDILTVLCKGGIHYQYVILLSGKDPQGFDPVEA